MTELSDSRIVLGLLRAIERSEAVTQRSLAGELGIALGLVNSYMKRCAKKGFIKIKGVPRQRYAYYLTPQGFAEKSRLTISYLSHSFDFFRQARADCTVALEMAEERGFRTIALAGAGDLAEIAVICGLDRKVRIAAVIVTRGAALEGARVAGLPVIDDLALAVRNFDGVVVTEVVQMQEVYRRMCKAFGAGRVIVPELVQPVLAMTPVPARSGMS